MPEPKYRIEACRSEHCRKAIIWARTPAGKMMPVDACPLEPDKIVHGGTFVALSVIQGYPRAEVHTLPPGRVVDRPLRTSHFATCDDVQRFRRERNAGNAASVTPDETHGRG